MTRSFVRALGLTIFLNSTAWADSILNVSNGDWNTLGNWSPSGVPTASTVVQIGTTSSNRIANLTFGDASSSTAYIGVSAGNIGTVNVLNAHTWTASGQIYVGYAGNGTLNIQFGGVVGTDANIGRLSGSTGTATVTGPNSMWQNNGQIVVGDVGNGSLNVLSSGVVSDVLGIVGGSTGGTGTATVSGTGSQWNSSDATIVGNYGGGTLNIQNGGKVSNTNIGFIGYQTTGVGTVTVSGTGSQWVNGTTTRVGLYGNGTLNVQSGALVTDTSGYVGYYSGSTGTATVDGIGSQWTHSGNLYVGTDGTGSLTIQNGGKVTDGTGYIGSQVGAGTVTVTGTGSQWLNSSAVYVGNSANGSLNVQNGGVVSNVSSGVISNGSSSTSTATVTGAGSQWNSSAPLFVGYGGNGTLTVDAEGKVTAPWLEMAYTGSGRGTLNLNGSSGSRGVLETGNIVEETGTGGAHVNFNGGILRATADSTNFLQNFESGDVQIQSGGAFFDTNGHNVTVNVQFGGTGGITKQGAGTLTLGSAAIFYGSNAVEGGTLANDFARLGLASGDVSSMTVTGSGSQWTTGGANLVVGNDGSGTLNIQNGGTVTSGGGQIGGVGSGLATVTGVGSLWNASGSSMKLGNGTLNIQNGGIVNSSGGDIGLGSGTTGMVIVTGAGSQWNNVIGSLIVGDTANGSLSVDPGAKVTAPNVLFAANSGTVTGTLNLNGTAGSRGVVETALLSEGSGTGGGHINFNGGILRTTANQSNFLQNFETGDVQVQSGGAFIDTNGFNIGISTALQGAGGLTKQATGTLTLSGSSSFTGSTSIETGTLEVTANNALGTAAGGTTVANGAALKLSNVNYSTAEPLAINGTGVSGGGALVNSGNSTFAGQVTVETDATINAGGGTLNLNGGLVKNGTTSTIAGGGRVNILGTGISGASANSDLVVDGTTLVVNANSNYNGPTTVQNNATLVANAAITTTQMAVSSDSTLSGTGSITTAGSGSYVVLNGALIVGDSTLGSPVASSLDLKSSGPGGSTVLGTSSGSFMFLDLFQRGGDLTAVAAAADYVKLFGTLDATLGGTLVIGNPASLTGFAAGDKWKLFDLSGPGSITGVFGLDYSSLNLVPTLTALFNNATGVFSIEAVPEPGRAALLLLGMMSAILRRRRKVFLCAN